MAIRLGRIALKQMRADPPKQTSRGKFLVEWFCEGASVGFAWLDPEELDIQISICKTQGWDWTAHWEPRADLHAETTGLIPQLQELA